MQFSFASSSVETNLITAPSVALACSLVVNLEKLISQAFRCQLQFCGSHFTLFLIPITLFNQVCILNSFLNNYLFGISGIDWCMNCPIAFGLPVFLSLLVLKNVSCVLVFYLSLQMFLVFLSLLKSPKERAPHPPTVSVRGTLSLGTHFRPRFSAP